MNQKEERRIKEYLDWYGIPHSSNGYSFLIDVIKAMVINGSTIKLQGIYEEIGEQCGITGACVSSSIRYAHKQTKKGSEMKARAFIKDGVEYAKTGYFR